MAGKRIWPVPSLILLVAISASMVVGVDLQAIGAGVDGPFGRGAPSREDIPVVFNGTIPMLYAHEDNASSGKDLIDLSEWVWDPDGGPLDFTVDMDSSGGVKAWAPTLNGSTVSFVPGNRSEDWYGAALYPVHSNGSGPDQIWGTDDDPYAEFNLTLIVLPVNDGLPVLEYIELDGERIGPGLFQYLQFRVDAGSEFSCKLVYSDVDEDNVTISVVDPSNSSNIGGDILTFNASQPGSYGITLVLNDGWGNVTYPMYYNVEGERPEVVVPVFLGLSFDGETVAIPVVDGIINLTIQEDQELGFFFMFDQPGEYHISDVGEPVPFEIIETMGFIGPYTVPHEGDNASVPIEWTGPNGTQGGFIFEIRVLDVNYVPREVSFSTFGHRYPGSEIEFRFTWIDLDRDPLRFTIDFGDGSDKVMVNGSPVSHAYERIGKYRVLIEVSDGYGGYASSTQYINITDRPEDRSDVTVDHQDSTSGIFCILMVALMVAVPVVALMIISRRRKPEVKVITSQDISE